MRGGTGNGMLEAIRVAHGTRLYSDREEESLQRFDNGPGRVGGGGETGRRRGMPLGRLGVNPCSQCAPSPTAPPSHLAWSPTRHETAQLTTAARICMPQEMDSSLRQRQGRRGSDGPSGLTERDEKPGNTSLHNAAASASPLRSTANEPASGVDQNLDSELDHEWDYSETEWWGWVLLAATWIIFVVGMGSCFGVWSWVWDVGERPELQDDETLPITGYYPALIVCTAVMSWVWVVVAWVGMKYFRHSKVAVEDG